MVIPLSSQPLSIRSLGTMVRPPCCDKLDVRRGHWTEEEDAKILAYVSKHGTGNWTDVPKKAGLRRCGKSCRLRWTNYLRPDLRQETFTPQEEELIIRLHAAIGSRWSIIAQQLAGRTDNDVKNYWNTKLRKKLSEMGIDPVTHKPFSQILADYGNIDGLPKFGNRIGSLNRDIKNAFISKSVQSPIPQHVFSNFNMHFTTLDHPIQNTAGNYANNSSLDLLAQLQSITLVTEASSNYTNRQTTSTPHVDCSSSSAVSQFNASLSFSWRDFLIEDPFIPGDVQQEEEIKQEEKQDFSAVEEMGHEFEVMNSFESSSCSDRSFVEAIMDQQSDMLLEFPGLMEE
ncbi:unnamed protein product [Camellia sinensis]